MRLPLLVLALVLAIIPGAIAGSPTVSRQMTAPPARSYWLSEGLNRLVFWQPQTTSAGKHQGLADAR